jgi:hypothetical protein
VACPAKARDFIMVELATKVDVLAIKNDLLTIKSDFLATEQRLQTTIYTQALRLTV